jgi:spermidine/putrescine transport system substrate-binding protein
MYDKTFKELEELKQRYLAGELDRRSFLGFVGVAGLAAGFFGSGMRAMAQSIDVKQILMHSWGGVVQEAMRKTGIAAFEADTGIKVVEGTFGLEEEVLSKAKAGRPGDFNIINSAGIAWYKRWVDAGFGVKLNEANIPNLANVMPALLKPFREVTPDGLSAVPFSYGNTGIAYNKKFISPERALAEREKLLVAPDLKGKLSGHNDFQTRMWVAALLTGQDPNNIQDLDAVWENIRLNRSLVKKYWGSGAESTELLASGEVYATDIWSGRAASLIERDPNFGYVDYSTGYCWCSDLLVVKGSPLEVCEKFLNFILDKEVAIAVSEAQLYPPALDPTKVQLTKKIESLPNFDPTGTLSKFAFSDPNYWTKHEKDWKPKYARIEKGF